LELDSPEAFRLEWGPPGIAVLLLDHPPGRVNLLTSAVLAELARHIAALGTEPGLRGLVLGSGKPGHFLAGADVQEIRAVRDANEGQDKASQGQILFQRIAELPIATCAAIDGACLGGGLELALACRYRMASDSPRTSLGLPEVRLGILPAFGGTTRLPRLLGLAPALDLLLTGRSIDARRARRLGLVDDVLPKENFRTRVVRQFAEWAKREEEARAAGRTLDAARVSGRGVPSGVQRALTERLPPVRNAIFSEAEKRVRAETKGHYPAPLRILDVVRRSLGRTVAEGLAVEAQAAGELLASPVTRNLTGLFFLVEGAKKEPATPRALEVRAAGVLGAGVMGGGIAALLARHGTRVRLKDVDHAAVGRGLATAHALYQREVSRGRIPARELRDRMTRISGTVDYSGFGRLDLVVEAVVENLEVKRGVLAEVERLVPPDAVLATNTSSLRIEALAEGLVRPQALVGMHFFNPVHRMPLVEVVVGKDTGEAARDTAVAYARALGKTPVVVRSSPGFLVNRILMPYLMEALHLFERGVPVEPLDKALEDFGMPLGPLALVDEVGLDVAHRVSEVLAEAFPDRGRPPRVLRPMLDAGRLGRKNGFGFYRYTDGVRRPDPAVSSLVTRPSRATAQAGPEAWALRLVLAMVNEAARCLEEGVVGSPQEVDLAMVLGTGFPGFRGGLLRYADERGAGFVANQLQALAGKEGPRFEPAGLVRELAASRGRFRSDGA
jgi:3-hydroxyacyl-CoA dehydrogenase/enoyl-CoA hydratase/3-hydroxybutyryl-CoA epimerase